MKFQMRRFKTLTKGVVSVLLVLAVMLSLAVPFDLTVFADGPATDDDIYALLYIVDPTYTTPYSTWERYKDDNICVKYNFELVFQKGPTPTSGKYFVKAYHLDPDTGTSFASVRYHDRVYSVNSGVPSIKSTTYKPCPWYSKDTDLVANGERIARNIVTVDFKDKIAPTYIASWFYGFDRIREFKHLGNLDLSNCKDMSYAFYCSTSTNTSNDTTELTELDFSQNDISNVEEIDCFVRSNSLQKLNLSNFNFSNVKYLKQFIS